MKTKTGAAEVGKGIADLTIMSKQTAKKRADTAEKRLVRQSA